MIKVAFYNTPVSPEPPFKFAVIAARYDGKWVFCRHKQRSTWEIPGGHREPGEDIAYTAKRELHEETGAVDFDIKPVCAYSVLVNVDTSYGKLFFANIKSLGDLPPEMEIGEIMLSNNLPHNLTYPEIQTPMFEFLQGWLNLQCNADELWDVYDENRNLTGRTHRRGDPLPAGEYHLIVHVWLRNEAGLYLLTKRAPNKGFPNMWECTGGSALAGDDSLAAAIREVREETGLTVRPESGKCVLSSKRDNNFCDVWLFKQNFNLNEVVLQPGETCDVKYASVDEILKMWDDGTLMPYGYLDEFFESVVR